MINLKAALAHHLLDVPIAQSVGNVPPNALQNNKGRIVTAGE
jgi:hypothetical protein